MRELPVTLGRSAKVFWSIFWRAISMIIWPALAWKIFIRRSTTPVEAEAYYLLMLVLYVIATWWMLRRNSWKDFRIVLVARQ